MTDLSLEVLGVRLERSLVTLDGVLAWTGAGAGFKARVRVRVRVRIRVKVRGRG